MIVLRMFSGEKNLFVLFMFFRWEALLFTVGIW